MTAHVQVIIPGRFRSLNEFIDANRRRSGNWSAGNKVKQADQNLIRHYLPKTRMKKVWITYRFYEPNKKRDKDNVCSYFMKVFQDALVQSGIIANDGWECIAGFDCRFFVDRKNPRIEVEIEEWK